MKEIGIIMSGDHPRLILEQRKVMTRRTYGLEKINEAPDDWNILGQSENGYFMFRNRKTASFLHLKCPYGGKGDRLVIKETWATEKRYNHLKPSEIPDTAKIYYINKLTYVEGGYSLFTEMGKIRSAMFMCNWMSMAKPEITEVRAERLQEITEEDAVAEGCLMMAGVASGGSLGLASARYSFMKLWDFLNAKRGFGWDKNNWVFPISFKLLSG